MEDMEFERTRSSNTPVRRTGSKKKNKETRKENKYNHISTV